MDISEESVVFAVGRLEFATPARAVNDFVDLTLRIPIEYDLPHSHDLTSNDPPEGMNREFYLRIRDSHVLMLAALSMHDQNVIDEGTERFREDFWEKFGESEITPKYMREFYKCEISDCLVKMLRTDGPEALTNLGLAYQSLRHFTLPNAVK